MSLLHNRSIPYLVAKSAVFVGLVVLTPLVSLAEPQTPPNVLFIMADDLGYGDVSVFGRPDYRTPSLDQLASEGLKLTNAYANSPVCSPTRVALLTGNYQYRLRVGLEEPVSIDVEGVPAEQLTIAKAFRSAGYRTALVGKWHLGTPPRSGPTQAGYEHFFGFYPGGIDYFAHAFNHGKRMMPDPFPKDGLWRDDQMPVKADGYLTDIFADEAVAYIEKFAGQSAPFFISLHFSAPHWPWEGPNDVRQSRDLSTIVHFDGGNAAVYAAMVRSLDANIGRIMATLDKLDIADNTIVVFTSDNGGERFSYNWPYLGNKGEVLEGGIRVPGIVRWPAAVAKGKTSKQVVTSMDWMPTLMSAAGIALPDTTELDGKNVLNALLHPNEIIERSLFWRLKSNQQAAMRSGDWKYVRIKEGEYLFNVVTDQREQANLKNRYPEKFRELKQRYERWSASMLPYPDDSVSQGVDLIYTDRY